MSATQISFTAFALAAFADNTRSIAVLGGVDTHQVVSVVLCAPPVTQAASVLVAQPVAADGGECIQPHADYAEFDRLMVLANETFCPPFADCWSRGGYVLAALANCVAPQSDSSRSQSERLASLRYMAAECIGAGC